MAAARYWRIVGIDSHDRTGDLELSALHLYSADGDPDYYGVGLLLHGDGVDGSTTFTDNSPSQRFVTPNGNAQISTAQSKFGGASMRFDGVNSYLSVASSDFNMPGDFTVEFWFRVDGATDNRYQHLIQTRDGSGNGWVFEYDRTDRTLKFASDSGLAGLITSTNAIADLTWYHACVTRFGAIISFFLDGVLINTVVSSQDFTASNLIISRRFASDGSLHYMNGYIDDLRITKGVARYAGSFTLPTTAFPNGIGEVSRSDVVATLTSTIPPVSGLLSNLQDADSSTFARFDVNPAGFAIQWDFGPGNSADVAIVAPGSAESKDRFLSTHTLQRSNDAANWTTVSNLSQVVWPGANSMPQVSGGDVYYNKVSLLITGDGFDGATTFTDKSPLQKTLTPFGNVYTSTAQSKFGGSSVYFDGSGDYLQLADSTDWYFGSGAFTFEFWAKKTVASASYTVASTISGPPFNGFQLVLSSTALVFVAHNNGTSVTTSGGYVPDTGWHHYAVCSNGSNLFLFIDGVQKNSTTASPVVGDANAPMRIGIDWDVSSTAMYGYIDDLRITTGLGRYSSSFSPPTASFANFSFLVTESARIKLEADSSGITLGSSGVPNTSPKIAIANFTRDMEDFGLYRITGSVKEKALPSNTPLRRRVQLFNERSGRMIREAWSDAATGNYTFDYIRGDATYFVVSFDYLQNYRAVVADNLTPEVMS